MINRKSILTAALCVVCSSAIFANATIEGTRNETKVSFSHLDLSKPAGQQALYKSLQRAAHKVCGSNRVYLTHSLKMSNHNQRCYEDALSSAIDRIGNRGVAILHESS